MDNAELVAIAAEAYLYHKTWRRRGKPPYKCPHPSAGVIIDRELDARGVTRRPDRDRIWSELAGAAFEVAEQLHGQPSRTGQRRDYFLTHQYRGDQCQNKSH